MVSVVCLMVAAISGVLAGHVDSCRIFIDADTLPGDRVYQTASLATRLYCH